MNPRRAVAAIGLVLAAGLQAAAWYGGRSMVYRYGSTVLMMDMDSLHTVLNVGMVTAIAGAIAAVVLTLIAGPGPTAAAGLALSAVGMGLYAVLPAETYASAGLIAGFGHGMFAPALFGAAAIAFGRGHEGARNALFTGLYVVTNLGAMLTMLAPEDATWAPVMFALGAVGLGIAAAIVGLVAFLDQRFGADPANADTSDVFDPQVLGLSLGVGAVGAGVIGVWAIGVDLDFWNTAPAAEWVYSLNPSVVGFVGTAAIAGWIVVQVGRVPMPALAVVGFGAILGSVAIGSGVLPQDLRATLAGVVAVTVLGAVAETLLIPALQARAAGDVHWRASAAAPAMLTVASALASLLAGRLGNSEARILIQAGSAMACGLGGALLIAVSVPLQLTVFASRSADDAKIREEALPE